MAKWLNANFKAHSFLSVWATGHQTTLDKQLYDAAKEANAVLVSKDIDMVYLYERFGSPPKLMWLTIGNGSKHDLYFILKRAIQRSGPFFWPGVQPF